MSQATVNAPSAKPIRKVAAGGAAGAVTTIVVWALSSFVHIDVPSEVAAALTLLVMFGVSYFVPSTAGEMQP